MDEKRKGELAWILLKKELPLDLSNHRKVFKAKVDIASWLKSSGVGEEEANEFAEEFIQELVHERSKRE